MPTEKNTHNINKIEENNNNIDIIRTVRVRVAPALRATNERKNRKSMLNTPCAMCLTPSIGPKLHDEQDVKIGSLSRQFASPCCSRNDFLDGDAEQSVETTGTHRRC